jgi:hypothetical protein
MKLAEELSKAKMQLSAPGREEGADAMKESESSGIGEGENNGVGGPRGGRDGGRKREEMEGAIEKKGKKDPSKGVTGSRVAGDIVGLGDNGSNQGVGARAEEDSRRRLTAGQGAEREQKEWRADRWGGGVRMQKEEEERSWGVRMQKEEEERSWGAEEVGFAGSMSAFEPTSHSMSKQLDDNLNFLFQSDDNVAGLHERGSNVTASQAGRGPVATGPATSPRKGGRDDVRAAAWEGMYLRVSPPCAQTKIADHLAISGDGESGIRVCANELLHGLLFAPAQFGQRKLTCTCDTMPAP